MSASYPADGHEFSSLAIEPMRLMTQGIELGADMKLWYQVYSAASPTDERWSYYEKALARHFPKVARPNTQIDIHAVIKYAQKMLDSSYFQYLHLSQVIENGLEAQREGYDAFILGGTRDLGYSEIREALDIPVVFIAEASYHLACLLATKFSVVQPNSAGLRATERLIKRYGLEQRYAPGVHMGIPTPELAAMLEKTPEDVVDIFTRAARTAIDQDADILVPGFGGLGVFLVEQGIRQVDGVPILDIQAAAIKTAEMVVDLKRLGISRPRKVSKEEVTAARILYGVNEGR